MSNIIRIFVLMKTIKLTARQMEVMYHSIDERTPSVLQEEAERIEDRVFKTNTSFILSLDKKSIKWLKSEAKSFIKHLQGEIKDVKAMKVGDKSLEYWRGEAVYHVFRIRALKNLIKKL